MRTLLSSWVSGRFLVRPAEITNQNRSDAGEAGAPDSRLWKLCSGGSLRHREMGRSVTTPSDVTKRMQISTNPGKSIAAGVVLRCLDAANAASNQVLQTLCSGSGVQVELAGLFAEPSRAMSRGRHYGLVSVAGWHQSRKEERKNGRAILSAIQIDAPLRLEGASADSVERSWRSVLKVARESGR